jgi:hypothetical protein
VAQFPYDPAKAGRCSKRRDSVGRMLCAKPS